MVHSHFTLRMRACDYIKRLSQHPWYGLWMRVKGPHHYKVTTLGSYVKWPSICLNWRCPTTLECRFLGTSNSYRFNKCNNLPYLLLCPSKVCSHINVGSFNFTCNYNMGLHQKLSHLVSKCKSL
jgi:hypothetical protein